MKRLYLLLLLLPLLAPAGCRKNPDAEAPEIVVMKKREAAQRRAEALLQGLDRKLADLRARAQSTAAGSKREARESLAALEEKKMRVQMKLDELKSSSKDAAKTAAEGVETAVDDLEHAYRDAVNRFK